jgi:D-alanyl-D-alanine carboxypeptidase
MIHHRIPELPGRLATLLTGASARVAQGSGPMKPLQRREMLALGSALLAGCGGRVEVDVPPSAVACPAAPVVQTPRRAALPSGAFAPPYSAAQHEPPVAAASSRLDVAFDRALAASSGVAFDAALLQPGVWQWQRRAGQRGGGLPVDGDTEFWWASCGKALTASLLLQAEGDGRLRLGDRLSRWYPELPRANETLLGDLLVHTSALLSYNDPVLGTDPVARYRSPAELLALVQPRSAYGCPGLRFAYSNTNYLLLALVLERVWGRPFHELLHERIARPLGLPGLRALAPREEPARLAQGHDAQGRLQGQPELSSLIGAGNVLGGAADWVRVWQALLDGRLAGPPQPRFVPLLDMGLPDTRAWYGQGVMVLDWLDQQGRKRTWLNHTGGARDSSNAVVFWDPLLQVYGAVASNSPAPAGAMANALLTAVEAMA